MRRTAESCLRLYVWTLAKAGACKDGARFSIEWAHGASVTGETQGEQIIFSWTTRQGGERRQAVRLERTSCHYGGTRLWFRCPHCGRRIGVLHLAGDMLLSCRECLKLVYQSTRERGYARACSKRRALLDKLGPYGDRPKGMHAKTYARLSSKLAAAEAVITGTMQRFVAAYRAG